MGVAASYAMALLPPSGRRKSWSLLNPTSRVAPPSTETRTMPIPRPRLPIQRIEVPVNVTRPWRRQSRIALPSRHCIPTRVWLGVRAPAKVRALFVTSIVRTPRKLIYRESAQLTAPPAAPPGLACPNGPPF